MSTSHNAQSVVLLRHMAHALGSSISDSQAMALMEMVKYKRLRMKVTMDSIERELALKSSDPGCFNRTLTRLKTRNPSVLTPFLKLLYLLRTSQEERSLFKDGSASSVSSTDPPGWMRAWYHQEINCETQRPVNYSNETLHAKNQHEEKMFLTDFFNSLLGVYGGMIKRNGHNKACLTDSVSDSLKPLAMNFLPLIDGHSALAEFVTTCNELILGRVNQALAAFIQETVLRKFYASIEAVESSHQFSMRDILLEFRESAQEFEVALKMIEKVRGKNGGECLSALHEFAGRETSPFYNKAIRAASQPFFDSLCTYLSRGLVDDIFQDFMILMKPNAPWDKIFSIVVQQVPSFIEPYSQNVLKTGKYVYAVKKCYEAEGLLLEKDPVRLSYGSSYEDIIKKAYEWADGCLLNSILIKHKLPEVLKTIVMFCSKNLSDFFMCLVENMAPHFLFKPVNSNFVSKLASDISRCLVLSKMGGLQHHDLLKIHFKRQSLEDQILKGTDEYKRDCNAEVSALDALTFSIEATWPNCIILDDLAIERYQILFRHALQIRLTYYKLTKVHSLFKKLTATQCLLKHCMLSFISSLLFYTTVDVIQSHWLHFSNTVVKASSVDELREAHETFQHDCLVGCMINPPSVYASLKNVLDACSQFSESVDVNFEEVFFSELAHLLNSVPDNHILHPFILTVQPTFAHNRRIAQTVLPVSSGFSPTESFASHYKYS